MQPKVYLITIVVALVATAVVPTVEGLKYTICEPAKSLATIKAVQVSDCVSETDPCPFLRGFNKTIDIEFVPKQKVEQVKIRVAGKLSKLPVPFIVNPDVACGNYGFTCPLEADKAYKFELSLPILRSYPKLGVDVIVKLVDEKDELLGCVEIPAKIQEPAKPDA